MVVSYPKSGRTWLELILLEVLNHRLGLSPDVNRTLLDVCSKAEGLPYIVFTHAGSSWETRQMDEDAVLRIRPGAIAPGKFVFLYRDPRDTLVSSYYHLRHRTGADTLEKQDMIDHSVVGARKLLRFLKVWYDYAEHIPDRGLRLSYEKLRSDTIGEIQRLCLFIGFSAEHDEIARAVEACSFSKLREIEQKSDGKNPWITPSDYGDARSFKFRKGQTGEHKDFFSPEQAMTLRRQMEEELPLGLRREYLA